MQAIVGFVAGVVLTCIFYNSIVALINRVRRAIANAIAPKA